MLAVRSDFNRHVVCVFNQTPRVTYYLGVESGPELKPCQMPTDQFERIYYHVPKKRKAGEEAEYTPLDFAVAYTRTPEALKMVPISSSGIRVLTAILKGQSTDQLSSDIVNSLENAMATAKEEGGFRKPDGNVAKVHKYLDSRLDAIKAGTVSRKELIDALVGKDIPAGTAQTQAGVWARNNGIAFVRPTQAKEIKAAKRTKAAKKAKKTAAAA